MPPMKSFESIEDYYDTLFHELVHASGHESRTDRLKKHKGKYGKEEYVFEELVAELGSCYLNSFTGIAEKEEKHNISYIASCLTTIKNDKKLLVMAAAHSQDAVDYILTFTH